MTNLQQPYFLECNRSNSTILSTDDNYNAVWSSEISPFQLKPGDQVSVSSVAIEASSIGTILVLICYPMMVFRKQSFYLFFV